MTLHSLIFEIDMKELLPLSVYVSVCCWGKENLSLDGLWDLSSMSLLHFYLEKVMQEGHADQVHHHKGLRLDHVNQSLMPSIQKQPELINVAVERRDREGEAMVKKLLSFSRIFLLLLSIVP